MPASRSSAAAECKTGIDTLDKTDPTIAASLSEHDVCFVSRRTLSQSRTHLAEGEEDALEERGRLVQALLERFVQVDIELASVHPHVFAAFVEQHALEEHPRLGRLQVGHKDLGARQCRVRRPLGRARQCEKLRPVR